MRGRVGRKRGDSRMKMCVFGEIRESFRDEIGVLGWKQRVFWQKHMRKVSHSKIRALPFLRMEIFREESCECNLLLGKLIKIFSPKYFCISYRCTYCYSGIVRNKYLAQKNSRKIIGAIFRANFIGANLLAQASRRFYAKMLVQSFLHKSLTSTNPRTKMAAPAKLLKITNIPAINLKIFVFQAPSYDLCSFSSQIWTLDTPIGGVGSSPDFL